MDDKYSNDKVGNDSVMGDVANHDTVAAGVMINSDGPSDHPTTQYLHCFRVRLPPTADIGTLRPTNQSRDSNQLDLDLGTWLLDYIVWPSNNMSKVVFGAQGFSPSVSGFGVYTTHQSEMCLTTWVKTSSSMSSSRSDRS